MNVFTENQVNKIAEDFYKRGVISTTAILMEIISNENDNIGKRFVDMMHNEDSELLVHLRTEIKKELKEKYSNPINN